MVYCSVNKRQVADETGEKKMNYHVENKTEWEQAQNEAAEHGLKLTTYQTSLRVGKFDGYIRYCCLYWRQ
jgi:hypothetical protein